MEPLHGVLGFIPTPTQTHLVYHFYQQQYQLILKAFFCFPCKCTGTTILKEPLLYTMITVYAKAKKPAYVILIVSLQKKIDTPSVSAPESSVLRKTQTVTALHITIHALLTQKPSMSSSELHQTGLLEWLFVIRLNSLSPKNLLLRNNQTLIKL